MENLLLAWKKEASTLLTKQELSSEFPGENPFDDAQGIESSFLFGLLTARFEWDLVAQSDMSSYRLVERAYISRIWHLVFAASIAGVCLGVVGVGLFEEGFLILTSLGYLLVSLLFILALFAALARLDSPVDDVFRQTGNNSEFLPFATLLVASLPPLFLTLVLEGIGQIISLIVVVSLCVVYYGYYPQVREFSFRWQTWLVERTQEFPLIASNYLVMVFLNSIILLVFILSYRETIFLTLIDVFPLGFPLIVSILLVPLIGGVVKVLADSWRYESSRFQQQGNNITDYRTLILISVLVLGFSAGFGVVAYYFLQGVAWFIPRYGTLGAYVFILITGSPIIFLGAGLCYQVVTVARSLAAISRNIEHRDLTHLLDVDAETYVLNYSGLFAGALSLSNDYIIVSQDIINELDDDEIAAVLAHEECHIKHNETRITLLIAVLSPFLLTGKNILYGLMDFRGREYRADRYAASRVDNKQQVIDALDSLQDALVETSEDRLSTVTPTLVAINDKDDEPSQLKNILDFYFGDFGFSKAHPTISERKNKLR